MTSKLPPVYVISLAWETARRENIARRLDALGANYQIVDAVDGKTLHPSQYEHRLQMREYFLKFGIKSKLTMGEIGCFMSHHNLWQQIANGEDDYALILEDDAVWDDDFADIINRLMECEWHWDGVSFAGYTTTAAGRVVCDLGDKRKLFQHYRYAFTAEAYLLSRTGAKKLRDYCQTISAPLDWMMPEYWRHGATLYCIMPNLSGQTGEESAIGERYKNPPKRTLTEQILGSILRKADRIKRAIYIMTHPPRKR